MTATRKIFEPFEDPIFYYYLGLMASDGNIFKVTSSIELQYRDRMLLKQLYVHIKNRWARWNPTFEITGRVTARLRINSRHLVNILERFNVVPCKSLILKFANNIPDHFMRHYIRGYFDGDGSLSCRRNTYCVEIYSGSKDFLIGFKDYISKRLNLSDKNIYYYKNKNTYRVSYYNNEAKLLLEYMYENEDYIIKLKRKYKQYKNNPPIKSSRFWTEKEIQYLKNNYIPQSNSWKLIARKLKRSPQSVSCMISRIC